MPITAISDYLDAFTKLSAAKEKILRRLWSKDRTPFPKPWVPSKEILALTGQNYFDRRIRELRDQLGCDIETAHRNGEYCYRIVSPNRNSLNPRMYLSASKKKELFEKHSYTCQICGVVMEAGVRGLQAAQISTDRN